MSNEVEHVRQLLAAIGFELLPHPSGSGWNSWNAEKQIGVHFGVVLGKIAQYSENALQLLDEGLVQPMRAPDGQLELDLAHDRWGSRWQRPVGQLPQRGQRKAIHCSRCGCSLWSPEKRQRKPREAPVVKYAAWRPGGTEREPMCVFCFGHWKNANEAATSGLLFEE